MPYAHRENGVVRRLTNQPNGSNEYLNDEDPEVIGFNCPPEPTRGEVYAREMKNNRPLKAAIQALNKAGAFSHEGAVLTRVKLEAAIKAEM